MGGDDERVAERAELTAEEKAAGSSAPGRQAEVILEESEDRTLDPEGTRDVSPQSPERD